MPQASQNNCICPLHPESIKELCPACQSEWERWMNETAMPALRQAIALEESQAA